MSLRRQRYRPQLDAVVTRTVLLLAFLAISQAQRQHDPSTLNGGSLLAMAGQECVAVAIDQRFGRGSALVNVQPRSVLIPSPHLIVTLTGLQGDVQSLQEELLLQLQSISTAKRRWSASSDTSRRPSETSPRSLASMISRILYQRKRAPYFVESIVVGLQPMLAPGQQPPQGTEQDVLSSTANGESSLDLAACKRRRDVRYRPFLCSMDMIGAQSSDESTGFVCAGAATSSLYGTAQALYRPNLPADELVQLCCRAFMSALERDCLSGYGALLFLITPSGIIEYSVKGRDD